MSFNNPAFFVHFILYKYIYIITKKHIHYIAITSIFVQQ